VYNVFRDSFNLNKVIRSVAIEDGRVMILLDDLHERAQEVPDIDPRTNKVKGMKRQKNTFQSEIYLEGEDVERFYNATSI
jgi:hypothetical protein